MQRKHKQGNQIKNIRTPKFSGINPGGKTDAENVFIMLKLGLQ
jgi:hypothetical protein